MGYNSVADNRGSIFIHLTIIVSQIREILREFKVIAGHGVPRPSILMLIEALMRLLISHLNVSPIVFEILTFKARKFVFPTPPLLNAPRSGAR